MTLEVTVSICPNFGQCKSKFNSCEEMIPDDNYFDGNFKFVASDDSEVFTTVIRLHGQNYTPKPVVDDLTSYSKMGFKNNYPNTFGALRILFHVSKGFDILSLEYLFVAIRAKISSVGDCNCQPFGSSYFRLYKKSGQNGRTIFSRQLLR